MPELQQLIKENKPIYVRNRTGTILGEPHPYHLEIRGDNNDKYSIVVPAVRYPFLIANVPGELLARSIDLLKALQKKALELVDPDKAKKELMDPLAQATIDQALSRFGRDYAAPRAQPTFSTRTAQPGHSVAMQPRTATDRNVLQPEGVTDGPQQPQPLTTADQDIRPNIIQLCMDLARNPDLRDDVFLELNGKEPESFNQEELGYIINKCREHSKITQWAKKLLAERYDDDGVEAELSEPSDKQKGQRSSRRQRGPRLDR